jgi:hypothetical protein
MSRHLIREKSRGKNCVTAPKSESPIGRYRAEAALNGQATDRRTSFIHATPTHLGVVDVRGRSETLADLTD